MRLTKRKIRELIREALAEADMLAVDPDAERKESLDAIEYHLAAAKSNLASAEKAMHGDESGMIKDDYKLDIMDVIDGLEVLVDELEAQKARALGESRTRRNPMNKTKLRKILASESLIPQRKRASEYLVLRLRAPKRIADKIEASVDGYVQYSGGWTAMGSDSGYDHFIEVNGVTKANQSQIAEIERIVKNGIKSGEYSMEWTRLGESRTRRNPYPRMRNPKGQKHRLDPHVRPGARPPDTWDDIQPGRETFQWWKAVERMMGRFSPEEIVDRVVRKWGVSHAEVEAAMESIAQRRGID